MARSAFILIAALLCAAPARAEQGAPPDAEPAALRPDKSRYTLFNPTPRAEMRELSTDRPDKTESAYTVDAGHFQFELDFVTYTRDRVTADEADLRFEAYGVAPINLKLGLTNRLDLQVVVDSYVDERVTDRISGWRETVDGFGDVTIRLKRNLFGNDGGDIALAVMPFLKLPTSSRGLGNEKVEGGVIVPLAIAVADGIGVGLMTEVDLLEDGDDYAPSFINSATIAFDLTERLGLYTEIFTERSVARGAEWIVTFDAGFTFGIGDDTQFDLGANIGLTEAADDLNLFVGLSRRF